MKLLVIPKTEDHVEGPPVFRHIDIQQHETIILKSMLEEGFELCSEEQKHLLRRLLLDGRNCV
jgi:hypothetical protein